MKRPVLKRTVRTIEVITWILDYEEIPEPDPSPVQEPNPDPDKQTTLENQPPTIPPKEKTNDHKHCPSLKR